MNSTLIQSTDPKLLDKIPRRCSVCDREMQHYNEFLEPGNVFRTVCWDCQAREEKGFNARRDFRRMARSGYIPR